MSKSKRVRVKAKPEDFQRQHESDAGYDLRVKKEITLFPGFPEKVPTGVHVEIPKDHVGLIMLRSSIGLRGISMPNAVGVIDSGYRGEVHLILTTLGKKQTLFAGERVAQMLIVPLMPSNVQFVKQLKGSDRGENGFGSTGTK